MSKFYKMYEEFEEKGLKPNQVSVLAHLYDRMSLSIKNNFVDENGEFFVIYTNQALADKINLDTSTISRIFGKLEELGWIKIERQKKPDMPNLIKLPKYEFVEREEVIESALFDDEKIVTEEKALDNSFSPVLQNAMPGLAKCNTSYTNTIYTKTNNTVNTEKANHVQNDFDKSQAIAKELTMWRNATLRIGLSNSTVDRIQDFSKGNVIICRAVVRLILNARNSVAKANNIKNTPVTQFESNLNLQDGLGTKLDHIFAYIEKHNYKDYSGYLTKALKEYFTMAFGLQEDIKAVKPSMTRSKTRVLKETLPEWAKDDYKRKEQPKADPKKVAEMKQKIAQMQQR